MSTFGQILVPMITPFDEQGKVDADAAAKLMHHLVDNGCDGIVVTGTTGESATLNDDERVELFELAVSEVGDRADVLAGTGSNDTAHCVELTARASEVGVDGHLVVAPYYNKPPRRGLVEHYRAVAEATDKPIMLYNIPARCGINMAPDLQAEIAEFENVVAVKQSNPDLDQARRIVTDTGLELYCGDDNLFLPFLAIGGKGAVFATAHLVAKELKQIAEAVEKGDLEKARTIDESLQDVFETMFLTSVTIMTKAALALLGFKTGGVRLPLVEASESEVAAARKMLAERGMLDSAS